MMPLTWSQLYCRQYAQMLFPSIVSSAMYETHHGRHDAFEESLCLGLGRPIVIHTPSSRTIEPAVRRPKEVLTERSYDRVVTTMELRCLISDLDYIEWLANYESNGAYGQSSRDAVR